MYKYGNEHLLVLSICHFQIQCLIAACLNLNKNHGKGFESVKSSNMSGMEDAEIERVLREYDVFQAAKAGLLIPCQGKQHRLDHFSREEFQ
jgi:hypothetical protein